MQKAGPNLVEQRRAFIMRNEEELRHDDIDGPPRQEILCALNYSELTALSIHLDQIDGAEALVRTKLVERLYGDGNLIYHHQIGLEVPVTRLVSREEGRDGAGRALMKNSWRHLLSKRQLMEAHSRISAISPRQGRKYCRVRLYSKDSSDRKRVKKFTDCIAAISPDIDDGSTVELRCEADRRGPNVAHGSLRPLQANTPGNETLRPAPDLSRNISGRIVIGARMSHGNVWTLAELRRRGLALALATRDIFQENPIPNLGEQF